jgi:hypothetical protein
LGKTEIKCGTIEGKNEEAWGKRQKKEKLWMRQRKCNKGPKSWRYAFGYDAEGEWEVKRSRRERTRVYSSCIAMKLRSRNKIIFFYYIQQDCTLESTFIFGWNTGKLLSLTSQECVEFNPKLVQGSIGPTS